MTAHLMDILPDIKMCPMMKNLVRQKSFGVLDDEDYERHYTYLDGVIKNYIEENIKVRSEFCLPDEYAFGIQVVTQMPEHLRVIKERIAELIPEGNKIFHEQRIVNSWDKRMSAVNYFIGQRDPLDVGIVPDCGLVLEYLGIYEGQFVLVVYNENRIQLGYTLLPA